MPDDRNSYVKALKATGLFGFVQGIQILISLIRGKFVAVLIGPTGLGIYSLYYSSIMMILQFSSLGINLSALRNISSAYEKNDKNEINRVVKVFITWLKFTAIIGGIFLLIFAPLISKIAFNDIKYTWGLRFLSLFIVFQTLHNGNLTVLQGNRNLRSLAKASLFGSLFGLVITVPLYYFFRLQGIVPALIITSLAMYLTSSFFLLKLGITKVNIPFKEIYKEGSEMAVLGITLLLASAFGTLVTFGINSFISNYGTVADVGFYQAGMSVTGVAVGAVFTAMSSDYFPRLAAISHDNIKVRDVVNQQAEVIIIIIMPIMILLNLLAPVVIPLFLSTEFNYIVDFVRITTFGMLFKAGSFAFGYISFAKGDRKTYFILEGIFSNLLLLSGNILGYMIGGVQGLAFSYVIIFILYFIIVNVVVHKIYDFILEKRFIIVFMISSLFLGSTTLILTFLPGKFAHPISILIGAFALYYSFSELNKRIPLKNIYSFVQNKFSPGLLNKND